MLKDDDFNDFRNALVKNFIEINSLFLAEPGFFYEPSPPKT